MSSITSREPVRVVVVEDDAVTRKTVCLSIEAEPLLALAGAFDSMTPALAWLQTQASAPAPDVLLTDLGLPDGSGIALIRACAALYPRCDIMVLTMSSDEADVLDSIEAGASGYLIKGAYKSDISRAILSLRDGEAPMSPAIARMVLQRVRSQRQADGKLPGSAAQATLTKREQHILDLIARGESYGDIAGMLMLSVSTVQTHIKSIYGKLAVHSRGEAVFEAQRQGLLGRAPLTRAAED